MSARRLVLHVGAMKSGTTFIQSTLFANKAVLAERGIGLPGEKREHHAWAVKQFLDGRVDGRWEQYAAEVAAHDGTSVFSMEYLGPARPAIAESVAAAFDLPIEVVITARDLNRNLPAMWQETVQNGRSWTWEDYLAGVHSHRPGHRAAGAEVPETGRTFWRQQDLVRMAGTWADVVGADRVRVVTVPPPGAGRDLLWQRFASVIGTEPDHLAPPDTANESLGLASALVLRRLNELLDAEGLRFPAGMKLRKGLLCKQVLAARRPDEPSLGLSVADWVVEQSASQVEGLRALGVRLVGQWADLDPVDVPGISPEAVPEASINEASTAALAGVLAAWIKRQDSRR